MKRALIVGIGGQDGSYLADVLLAKGYRVYGVVRPTVHELPERLTHLEGRLTLLRGDLVDPQATIHLIEEAEPDEVYNFAGTTFVPASHQQPALTADCNGMGAVRLLDAIRVTNQAIRFYQASSSELFGDATESPQNETTPFRPKNPYGVAKLFAHLMTERYREDFGLYAVSGILFNHESPRRGLQFVTRKITHAAASISLGLQADLRIGDLDARRDWGFAGDYVKAMWSMLQQETPGSYVVATGALHSVRDLVEIAFSHVGLDWREYVVTDPQFLRGPADTPALVGDASLARTRLAWAPTTGFEDLIRLMVDADLARLDGDAAADPPLDWPAQALAALATG
jgi:GDPmannose 4,6-dehydratase